MPALTLRAALLAIAAAAALAPAAQADVKISGKPTQNMSCASAVCSPTAKDAVLNASDLANMLASGDVTVNTAGGLAKDIDIDKPLSWASTSRLTLDADRSVTVNKAVSVTGTGALTVTTNDGGKDGDFVILPQRGSIQFWDLNSSLIIDGNAYTLVGDIRTLASDIAKNPSGFYALAKDYDASKDGTYSSSPIGVLFQGTFEGLGNEISNFSLKSNAQTLTGLFAAVDTSGTVRDVGVIKGQLSTRDVSTLGLLVDNNAGQIVRCRAQGIIEFSVAVDVGGLVSYNTGMVSNSFSNVRVASALGGSERIGGLIGHNYTGNVALSYALRSTAIRNNDGSNVGGLVGENGGSIENSFTRNQLTEGKKLSNVDLGGLVGKNDASGTISGTYAAGPIANKFGPPFGGGLVGFDSAKAGSIGNSYWDLDMGIDNPSQGAGNIVNDPGITGLTDEQLKSGLPDGFDPKVWAINPRINDGYPYLRANPPK